MIINVLKVTQVGAKIGATTRAGHASVCRA
jgi:hypothetical protein